MRALLFSATLLVATPAFADQTIEVSGSLTPLERTLTVRAKQMMATGDISGARKALGPLVAKEIGEALRLTAETYDPRWLQAHGVVAEAGFEDVQKAAELYVDAKNHGDQGEPN